MTEMSSKEAAVAAVRLAMSRDRTEEKQLQAEFLETGVKSVAIDYGGEFSASVPKILERAVVAARREGVIRETHGEEGAVAGAAHEAVMQILNKAIGLNMGGKIGIARVGDHVAVCVFFEVGLLNLNDIVIGLGYRAVSV